MKCEQCNVEMNETKTEVEKPCKKGVVLKVVNIPASVCPSCNKIVVDLVSDKIVEKIAKHSKADTIDYEQII